MRIDLFILVLASGIGTASCFAGEVTFKLSGVGFEGGPAFEATLGGEVIAAGTVDNPVPDGQDFTFEVSDELLSSNGDLTLRLTNDYFGGEGQDRSLLILGASIGNQILKADDFMIVQDGTPVERDRTGGTPLWSGDEIAVVTAPADGWKNGNGAASAATALAQECSAYAEILGLSTGSAFTATLPTENFKTLIEQAKVGVCSVTITGYADKNGTEAANIRLTAARAASVLDALILAGARFPSANIVSTSGTDEFGPVAADNRRVSVQLWYPAPSSVTDSTAETESPIAQLAREAAGVNLAHLLALGWLSNGELYVRSSNTDPKEVLWLLEQVKARLVAGDPVLGPGQ